MSTNLTNSGWRRRSYMPARARPRKKPIPTAVSPSEMPHGDGKPRRPAASATPIANGTCTSVVMVTSMRKKRDMRGLRPIALAAGGGGRLDFRGIVESVIEELPALCRPSAKATLEHGAVVTYGTDQARARPYGDDVGGDADVAGHAQPAG